MTTGKVKFFNETKGFGFIIEDETNNEYFVHITSIEGGEAKEGDSVEFEVEEGQKGLAAVDVRIV